MICCRKNHLICCYQLFFYLDESQEPAKAEPRSECKRSEVTEKGKWLEEQTPEGYTYYWNDVTTGIGYY